MGYVTGWQSIRIKTTDRIKFIAACVKARAEGYELHRRSSKVDWPKFWRRKFKAEYRRYYVIDDSRIAYIPKEDMDYIKTGKLK